MRIAVPYYSGYVFQHFGRSTEFKIYEVDEKGQITASRVVETDGKTHGMLAQWLADQGVDTVLCGGIGQGMQENLTSRGISYYGGVTGACDQAVEAFLSGELLYLENPGCADETPREGTPRKEADSTGENNPGGKDDGGFHMPILF